MRLDEGEPGRDADGRWLRQGGPVEHGGGVNHAGGARTDEEKTRGAARGTRAVEVGA